MLYLQKNQENVLVLNINNNSQTTFTGYTLEFIHILSSEVKIYSIDTSDPTVYFSNIRYCTITIQNLDLNYLCEYNLNIYGDDGQKVYVTICMLEGQEESQPFTEYISPNEDNNNYIYIQE